MFEDRSTDAAGEAEPALLRLDGPHVSIAPDVLPDVAVQLPMPVARFRPLLSVFGALGLGLLGAAVWAGITIATDYQLGIIAVALGIMVGKGATLGGRGPAAQGIGAVVAALSYFVGQFIIVIYMVIAQSSAQQAAADQPAAPEAPSAATVGATAADGEDDREDDAAPAAAAQEAELIEPAADQPLPEEPLDLLGLLGLVFAAILEDTFTSMSAIFFGIAVWEGWRIPGIEAA